MRIILLTTAAAILAGCGTLPPDCRMPGYDHLPGCDGSAPAFKGASVTPTDPVDPETPEEPGNPEEPEHPTDPDDGKDNSGLGNGDEGDCRGKGCSDGDNPGKGKK